ncbi:MAG: exodeoxyribonuclease VII large subunit [Phycisphaeraceae bacterium]|nr:exodeoxyribonuclease VII large subunit [Phycisphaeraceae bacterium]
MTERLPFDPSKMAAPRRDVPAASSGAEPWSVTRLAGEIDAALRKSIAVSVRVVGEISGFRDRTHWYFDLKDDGAVVNCVMFASAARKISPPPRDGELVIVKGRVEFYAKGGKVSFILDSLERAGEGPLDRAFRELSAALKAQGYFDVERKKGLPRFPRRIAVITSRSAAALQDVINTRDRRCPAVGLVGIDVPVQGAAAAPLIARAIEQVSKNHARFGIDAAILTRGGGSKEDLWCFNERAVADAIYRCEVPLVAAIGHETDTTIAELVADERCATPTQAAMRLIPDRAELVRQIDSTDRRLATALSRSAQSAERTCSICTHKLNAAALARTRSAHGRIASVELRLERLRPQTVHARMIARIDSAAARLHRAMQTAAEIDTKVLATRMIASTRASLRDSALRVDAIEKHLNAIAPQRVVERGFSITLNSKGKVVRSISDVGAGDTLRTRVADGTIDSTVGNSLSRKPVAKTGASRAKSGQPDLFSQDPA